MDAKRLNSADDLLLLAKPSAKLAQTALLLRLICDVRANCSSLGNVLVAACMVRAAL